MAQQGFEIMQYQKPPLKGKQRQFVELQYVDTWKQRQQQLPTIQRQFQKIEPKQQNAPTVYFDKQTKKFCLFHGTTSKHFQSFTQVQKQIVPGFYLSFDLEEAVRYANDRYEREKRGAEDVLPALLVFRFKDSDIGVLKTLEYSNTHVVLKKKKDIQLFLKNTIVEMIKIKPSSRQQSKSAKQER